MLAVSLREHHHLDVRRVAADAREHVRQVGDFSRGQREPHLGIDARKRAFRIVAQHDPAQRAARVRLEQAPRLSRIEHQRLGHRVEQRRSERSETLAR
jgi:hypothetical protein